MAQILKWVMQCAAWTYNNAPGNDSWYTHKWVFCIRALGKRLYSAKEPYVFKEPTNHSHPIWIKHLEMIHGTCASESWHVHEWSSESWHTCVNQSCNVPLGDITVTSRNESCHIHEWVMSHTRVSHVLHIWMSPLIGLVTLLSRLEMSRVTYTSESCRIYEWVMSHIYKWVLS